MSFLYKRRRSHLESRSVSSRGLSKTGRKVKGGAEILLPQLESEPIKVNNHIVLPEKPKPDLEADLAASGTFMSHLSKEDLQNTRKLLELEGYVLQILEQIRPLLNDERPINRLPQNVLATIFSFAATPSTHNPAASTIKGIVSLARVCRYWRDTILHQSELWSDVHLRGQSPESVAKQIARCRGAPLRVYLHLPHWVFLPEERTLLQNLTEAMSLITDRRNQIRSLTVRIAGCRAFHDYFDVNFPNLEELVWDDLCVDNSPSHDSTPADRSNRPLPNPRYLSVKRSLDWPMKFATGLMRFKLEGPMIVPVVALLDCLRQNQTLEHLELVNLTIPFVVPRTQPITLSRLATFSTRNVENGHILSHVTLPRIRTIELAPVHPPREWFPTVWSGLQVPSDVDTVSLHYNHAIGTGSSMEISIVGVNKTRTQLFILIERTAGARFTTLFGGLTEVSLDSVTCLCFNGDKGREPQTWPLPSPNSALLRNLPHLISIYVCWTCVVEDVIQCLTESPRTCPELKVLRVKITSDTCDRVFGLVLALAKRRHKTKQPLHSVECVVGEARAKGGTVLGRSLLSTPEAIQELWNFLTQNSKLEKYLRRSE
ncbi:hypothetical protein BDM02DRAFT_3127798 [Thelephora ganbajun]|uniref:Uncharacterized protein n=1 Tax=Thelephora ganbajun TaxID=370292 RepID=A0ACB6ZLJ3_THEGA|nr:hypothetical protein BDM02DRAFT_3127798 [Thelephora ganbajun]